MVRPWGPAKAADSAMLKRRWSRIAAMLPGRTDDAVRNRYLRLVRKKAEVHRLPLHFCKPSSCPPPHPPIKRFSTSHSRAGLLWPRRPDRPAS